MNSLCHEDISAQQPAFESNGNIFYKTQLHGEDYVYKQLSDETSVRNAAYAYEIRSNLLNTDWVAPAQLVVDNSGRTRGYVARFIRGDSLFWWESRYSDDFPLAAVVGRVATAIEDGIRVGMSPRIEHAGNVLVLIKSGEVDVKIVDIDECFPAPRNIATQSELQQLETIFVNYDKHCHFHHFFEESNGAPRLKCNLSASGAVQSVSSQLSSPRQTLRVEKLAPGKRNRQGAICTELPSNSPRRKCGSHRDALLPGVNLIEAKVAEGLSKDADPHSGEQENPQQRLSNVINPQQVNSNDAATTAASCEALSIATPSSIAQPPQPTSDDESNEYGKHVRAAIRSYKSARGPRLPHSILEVKARLRLNDQTTRAAPSGHVAEETYVRPPTNAGWEMWAPLSLLNMQPPLLLIRPEFPVCDLSCAEMVDVLRAKIDAAMLWDFAYMSEEQRRFRRAAHVACAVFEKLPDESRNELLHTQVFCLLFSEAYRAHAGTLFAYVGGAWVRTDTVKAESLDKCLDALREAQGLFLLLATVRPERALPELLAELALARSGASRWLLGQLVLQDVAQKNAEAKADNWCYCASELCKGMHHHFAGNSERVTRNFIRWAGREFSKVVQRGLCFADCYVETARGVLAQKPMAPSNDCYVSIPAALHWKPSDDRVQYLWRIASTSFAGSCGLEVLVAANALVFSRAAFPELILAFIGQGGDGKTLMLVDLMSAVWGSGFGNCPTTMLQNEREFQQQGHNFLDSVWMTFDECRKDSGVEESVFKLFVAGGLMPLRKNHEQQTHYASFKFQGKAILMNTGDIPFIATAEEASHARRWRASFSRATFTNDESQVDPTNLVFRVDVSAKDWVRSGEAAVIWLKHFVIPFRESGSADRCRELLTYPSSESQLATDTKWFLQRLSRTTTDERPSGPGKQSAENSYEDPAVDLAGMKKVVEETYNLLLRRHSDRACATERDVLRLPTPSNSGRREIRKGSGQRLTRVPTKVDVLEAAIRVYPFFVRLTEQAQRGTKLKTFEWKTMKVACLDDIADKIQESRAAIGDFADWVGGLADLPWESSFSSNISAEEQSWRPCDDSAASVAEERELADTRMTCLEEVDLERIAQYAERNADRRPGQLAKFILEYKTFGHATSAGTRTMRREFARKVVGGKAIGRFYGPYLSLQNITREAREAAVPEGCEYWDITACHAVVMVKFARLHSLPHKWICMYIDNAQIWREAVAVYYGITTTAAKKHILCAANDGLRPRLSGRDLPSLPFVLCFARECRAVSDAVCANNAGLVEARRQAGKSCPGRSAFALELQTVENEMMLELCRVLSQTGRDVISYVFDGVLAIDRAGQTQADSEMARVISINLGFAVRVDILRQRSRPAARRASTNASIMLASPPADIARTIAFRLPVDLRRARSLFGTQQLPGDLSCAPAALSALFPHRREELLARWRLDNRPTSLAELLAETPWLRLRPFNFADALPPQGKYIVQIPANPVGHAMAIAVRGHAECVLYDSMFARAPRIALRSLPAFLDTSWSLVRAYDAEYDSLAPPRDGAQADAGAATMRMAGNWEERPSSDDDDASDASSAGSAASPTQDLLKMLSAEAESYTLQLKAAGGLASCRCAHCPFRTFAKKCALLEHRKHHTEERFYTAMRTQHQTTVCVALFNQERSQAVLRQNASAQERTAPRFLEQSATLIRAWSLCNQGGGNMQCSRKINSPELCWVLDAVGPSVRSKQAARGNLRCGDLYYTASFRSLMLGASLLNQCSVRRTTNYLVSHFVAGGSPIAVSLFSKRRALREIMITTLTSADCDQYVNKLRTECLRKQEWQVVSHDATYKILFSIANQQKMAQRPGGLYAAHTIRGITGGLAGVSLQRSEGPDCLVDALKATLPLQEMRAQCEYLVTDCASSALERKAQTVLPNIKCVVSDPLHLAFRVESAFGGKKSKLSMHVRSVMRKFALPAPEHAELHNLAGRPGRQQKVASTVDASGSAEASLCPAQYAAIPWTCYEEYAAQLDVLAIKYPGDMARRGDGKTTVFNILKHAARHNEYRYLMNGSIMIRDLPPSATAFLCYGTTGNEAVHKELKSWCRNIWLQKSDRMRASMAGFTLAKLITHNSAMYYDTTRQYRQVELLALVAPSLFESDIFNKSSADAAVDAHASVPALPSGQNGKGGATKRKRNSRSPSAGGSRRQKSSRRAKRTAFTKLKKTPVFVRTAPAAD